MGKGFEMVLRCPVDVGDLQLPVVKMTPGKPFWLSGSWSLMLDPGPRLRSLTLITKPRPTTVPIAERLVSR